MAPDFCSFSTTSFKTLEVTASPMPVRLPAFE
jgi:hypothetical protein